MADDNDSIIILPYNKEWPKMATSEIFFIKKTLSNLDIVIEHIGSTSIPNISAKPIIDIMVGVKSLDDARSSILKLESRGYSYWNENPFKEHFFFVKGLPANGGSGRTHHLHIIKEKTTFWNDQLLFRDYLRNNRENALQYEKLKHILAQKHKKDRDAYTQAKTEFVKSILTKASLR